MAGKILIVDDVATNRIVLKVKLGLACYESLQAGDGATALAMARDLAPDLMLLDLTLPDMDGIEVLRRLRADPATQDMPVVMISASNDRNARLRALQAGADEFLLKPVEEQMLLARIRNLIRVREAGEELRQRDATWRELGFAEPAAGFDLPGIVALIAARRETAMQWRGMLTPHLTDRLVVMSREEALAETPEGQLPDVYVIGSDVPGAGGGLRLMSDLRSRAGSRHASVCIVQAQGAADIAAIAFDLGANDLMDAGFAPEEMALRLRTLMRRKRTSDRLRASVKDGLRLAVTDPLTGLHNRRYAMPHLERIAERAAQEGRQFAVMLIDLDRFKSVNDTFGHAAGDAVLVEVARRLSQNIRAADLLARVGGEEFLVAMPDADGPTARRAAERLRHAVQALPIALPGGTGQVRPTVSVGLALSAPPGTGEDVQALIDRADRGLLAAKAQGRNQVTVDDKAA